MAREATIVVFTTKSKWLVFRPIKADVRTDLLFIRVTQCHFQLSAQRGGVSAWSGRTEVDREGALRCAPESIPAGPIL